MSERSSTSRVRWFYGTRKWRNCSKEYIKSVGGLCERCLEKGIYTPAELVHHKIHLTPDNVKDSEIAYGWDNLQALCFKCHAEIHSGEKSDTGRYAVDSEGRIVMMKDTPLRQPGNSPPGQG